MMYLGDALKMLPNNLQNFKLNISCNVLGYNGDNMKFFIDGMKKLPNSIYHFTI